MKLLQNAGIYIIRNRDNDKCYVGKDVSLGKRIRRHLTSKEPECKAIHNAIKKHGANAFDVELIHYPNISHDALKAVEMWKIRQLKAHRSQGGYNLTWGGDGWDSETARAINQKRVEAGTHNLQDSELARKNNQKRVEAGTHNLQGDSNPSHRRVAEGTHHLQGGEIQRASNQKRVAEGTHNFQDSEFKERQKGINREAQRKRLAEGTHPFLEKSFYSRRSYFQRIKRKAQRREFYRWASVILTTKAVCEERIYRKRTREGYFDVSIPDTSKPEQLDLF